MDILIFNWRDVKNPESGGAEILTHEMAKRWVRRGHEVVQFSATFKGSDRQELLDGVQILRRGSANIYPLSVPVHVAAYTWYKSQPKGRFDVVVDEIHGIPFFTPWYVREKKVALICEVAKNIWDAAFPFPLNRVGRAVESYYFHIYKNIPFLTISPSTKQELLHMGIKERHITVLPMGFNEPKRLPTYSKEQEPTLLFVARLTKAKGIEDALHVVAHVRKCYPNIRLWVVGKGNQKYEQEIIQLGNSLGVSNRVIFFGFVNEEKKFELMKRAHMLIVPSLKEGWGLTVPEAGYMGTPAVAYNVEGLRDVVVQGKTGILMRPVPEDMAREVVHLLHNTSLYRKLQGGAKQLALTYSWDNTARVALSSLQHH